MALTHAQPGEKIHVGPLGPALAGSKTVALVKTDRFELIRLVLEGGSSIPVHAVAGYASLQCVEGGVILDAGETIRMRPNDWVYLPRGEHHALRATEDTSLLLTIYFD